MANSADIRDSQHALRELCTCSVARPSEGSDRVRGLTVTDSREITDQLFPALQLIFSIADGSGPSDHAGCSPVSAESRL